MPRVFVVHEPTKRNQDGSFERAIDVTPAAEHGELVFLTPAGSGDNLPADPEVLVDLLWGKLKDATSADFLLPTGHPALIAMAAAIFSCVTEGQLNLLVWHRHLRRYQVRRATCWVPTPSGEETDVATIPLRP